MSKATPYSILASWQALPAAPRWQEFQAQLSRAAAPGLSPWTRRSTLICGRRAAPQRVSAAQA
jgi:hypothetical protein